MHREENITESSSFDVVQKLVFVLDYVFLVVIEYWLLNLQT